jgi:murein DD-endopeptidase MepM/ murein hydrolase activator NlpD
VKKVYLVFFVFLSACDLRQKIIDAPNDIGSFIASRYPALLAEPNTEIYQYASVLDYGRPDMEYGDVSEYTSYVDKGDYISYADTGDYVLPKQGTLKKQQTISSVSKDYGTLVIAEKKSFILSVKEVKVQKGDTAYSIAKKHSMPPQRLAVLNGLKEPYVLSIGQILKVENAEIVTTKTEITKSSAETPLLPQSKITTAKIIKEKPVIRSNAAIKLPSLSARSSSKFAWPIRGKILSDFGPKKSGLSNDGINISGKEGSTVGAADNGVVAYAGNELKGMGNLIIIQHSGGWMTVYAHLDDFNVRRGDKVRVGQKIGTVGQTGKVDSPQLHFEIRKGAKAFDPKKQMR